MVQKIFFYFILASFQLLVLGSGIQNATQYSRKKIIMAYLVPWTGLWPAGTAMGPAILPALKAVQELELLPGYEIEMYWSDTKCRGVLGMKKVYEIWMINRDIDVIIGDACSAVCHPLSLLASAWNVPMVSWGCLAAVLSDKEVHPTFTRSVGLFEMQVPLYIGVMKEFGWSRVGILCSSTGAYETFGKQLLAHMTANNFTTFFYKTKNTERGRVKSNRATAELTNILRTLKETVRIIVVILDSADFQKTVLIAREEGMLDGNYQIVTIDNYINALNWQDYHLLQGMLMTDIAVRNTSQGWLQYATEVLHGFANPLFKEMPGLTRNDSISTISTHAGKGNQSF